MELEPFFLTHKSRWTRNISGLFCLYILRRKNTKKHQIKPEKKQTKKKKTKSNGDQVTRWEQLPSSDATARVKFRFVALNLNLLWLCITVNHINLCAHQMTAQNDHLHGSFWTYSPFKKLTKLLATLYIYHLFVGLFCFVCLVVCFSM